MTGQPTPQRDPLRVERRPDGVAELVLAQPATGNALTLHACQRLRAHCEALETDATVRVVLLRAEGRAFCVGGALGDFAEAEAPGDLLAHMAQALHAAMLSLRRMPAPVVVLVQGAAAGAGLGLAAAGDLVFAARETASFTWAYTAVGLSGDGGVSWLLPRVIGLRRTQELALTNRRLGADEAAALGLVTQAVAEAELEATGRAAAARLARGPTLAFGAVKRLLDTSLETALPRQLDEEAALIERLADTADGREGVRAFLERRPPQFGAPTPERPRDRAEGEPPPGDPVLTVQR